MKRMLTVLSLLVWAGAVGAQPMPPAAVPPVLDQLRRADGAHVVPDRFLRRWDPVTVLFDADTGPAAGGAEDDPGRWVAMDPPRPGSWTWLGARTLQFRPAEAWTPLQAEQVRTQGNVTRLLPLLPVPDATGPADSDVGTADLDTVALRFAEPVDAAVLQRALRIELRPVPGLTATGAQPLGPQDFDIRPVPRGGRADPQTYLVSLKRPVPDGRVAVVRLSLSDEAGLDDPIFETRIRSAAPFGMSDAYCGDGYYRSTQDGALRCTPEDTNAGTRVLVVQMSAASATVDIVKARDSLRISPPVDDLRVTTDGRELKLQARFDADTPYRLTVAPGALVDVRGRVLASAMDVRFSFAPGRPTLNWDAAFGIAERFGPQMAPLRGHGYDRADIRIHPVDPLSRDFWPFPRQPLVTDDSAPPPLPGNEPDGYVQTGPISGDAMAARVAALGTPAVSAMVQLPIRRGGVDAKFGVDLAPYLSQISGAGAPGTYLVGLRATDGTQRRWMRVQVTDLVLTTVEEPDRVRFVVTSLSTARAVDGAAVRVEGVRDGAFIPLAQGVTGADGAWTMATPLATAPDKTPAELRRFVVQKGADTLVLEPSRGPKAYAGTDWQPSAEPWLGWTTADTSKRVEQPRLLCHVFTERPIYRPEEPVLIAGMVRRYRAGALAFAQGPGEVVVTAPNQQDWHLPVTLDDVGGFHVTFGEKTEPTGDYAIRYQPRDGESCGSVTVKKEAYRLPTFEVVVAGPDRARLDAPFDVNMIARFFAGGLVSGRPLTWRVTQVPLVWTPPNREGFLFSSDSRFSGDSTFRSTPVMNRDGRTDDGGSARLTLDPTAEPTAQPRQYLVEATVTGDDDLQVRATQRIDALPPFVLGVKVPRYLPQAGAIDPEVVALGPDGAELPNVAMTVRLVHRQWNSTLQASDFAQGSAKYKTEVVDETVSERQVASGGAALPLHFDAAEAGVYLVQLSATDAAGRTQTVTVDLFMAGGTPVTWSRPPSETVTLSTDKPAYDPGETATVIVQSPFQTGRALAVVEEPEGRFRYDWFDVANGFGRYQLPIRKQQAPRVAVHVLLMRGRLPGSTPAGAPFDQGKPATLAATQWVKVNPVQNRAVVTFDAPEEARPGQAFDMVLHLADPAGQPLAGEATVWMVDQAVLALAKEQPLDPLPPFLVDRPLRMVARDTRAMAFGVLPFNENPGGDEAGDFGMENISVRKNFTPVPLYLPRVRFGADGTARVHVTLPDTLTVFMLRAKAISGPDRFGFGTGTLKVRQPVVAQAVLPRFVRPGDTFDAGLIGRIVQGPGGAGRAAVSLEGMQLASGTAEQALTWEGQRPARVDWPVTVGQPATAVPGAPAPSARVRFLVQRNADRVSDAVQIDLPIRPDRGAVHRRQVLSMGPSGMLEVPPAADAGRPGSFLRRVAVAGDPAAVQLLGGLDLLVRQPVGGTEQRLSLARSELALLPFTPLLEAAGLQRRVQADVADAQRAITAATDEDGLVAFWPRTKGSVWLTAQAYRFLVAAGRAGMPVDKPATERMATVLTQALRSDYPHLNTAESARERVAALLALAEGGKASPAYAAELAARAAVLPTESVAEAALALSQAPDADGRLMSSLLGTLWSRVNILSRDGRPVVTGLQDFTNGAGGGDDLVLPSETRSLAEATTTVAQLTPNDPRLGLLRMALLRLSAGDGWGTTDATGAALRALAAAWQGPAQPGPVVVTAPDGTSRGTLNAANPVVVATMRQPGADRVQAPGGTAALVATDYTPTEPGAVARAEQNGLILTRTFYAVNGGAPLARIEPGADGTLRLRVGDVVEEVDELATPEDRPQVALRLPMAAGLEPLNPNLANATADATPSAGPTLAPSFSSFGDDEVLNVWMRLPKGSVTVRHRMRATVPGTFTAPPAVAELLYRPGVDGATGGARIVVTR